MSKKQKTNINLIIEINKLETRGQKTIFDKEKKRKSNVIIIIIAKKDILLNLKLITEKS